LRILDCGQFERNVQRIKQLEEELLRETGIRKATSGKIVSEK
jgi:hypothetical protein